MIHICRCRGVFLDQEFARDAHGHLGKTLGIDLHGQLLQIVKRDVHQVGIDALCDSLLSHLACDVQHILALGQAVRGMVAHEQGLAHSSTR